MIVFQKGLTPFLFLTLFVIGSLHSTKAGKAQTEIQTQRELETYLDYEANYLGCYQDKIERRQLAVPIGVDMSIVDCNQRCAADGWALTGILFGGGCWCGDVLPYNTADNCNFNCVTGGGICGGDWALSIWKTGVKDYLERLPSCEGAITTWWGDPHMLTFDGIKYDCMGIGTFRVLEAGPLEIQGLYQQPPDWDTFSSTTGVAVTYEDYPVIQISIAPFDTEHTEVYQGLCPMHVFVDGVLVSQDKIYDAIDEVELLLNGNTFEIQFPDGPSVDVTIRHSRGCILDTIVCLPPEIEAQAKGLIGTPDGDINNEWTDRNGTVLPYPSDYRRKGGYEYCTEYWCIRNETESNFVYENGTFADYDLCDKPYEGLDPDDVPDDVKEKCANITSTPEDLEDCYIEMIIGGGGEDDIIDQLNKLGKNDTVPNITVTPVCPEDIVLLGKFGPDYERIPIEITKQSNSSVELSLRSPLSTDGLDHLQYSFKGLDNNHVCEKHDGVDAAFSDTFVVDCLSSEASTLVRVYASDAESYTGGTEYIPECCEAGSVPTASYVFLVACTTRCPT